MRRWYNIELGLSDEIVALKKFLKNSGFKYETSGAYNLTHFEILLTPEELRKTEDFLVNSGIVLN